MKKLIKALSFGALALGLAACGQDAEADVQETAAPAESPVAEAPNDTNTDSDLEVVVLYSNALSDGRGEWIQEHAREIGIDLQLVDGGGVAIANRILAEQGNPMADVVFGLNQLLWADLIREGAIVPYVLAWADEIPAGLNDANGYFHAVALVGNLLAFDAGQLDASDAPTDWLELWNNPEFHGRYALPNALTGSTVQMVLSGIFNRFLDADGDMGLSEEGWANIAAMFANGVPTDQDIFAEIVNPASDVVLGQIWHMGIAPREESFDMTAGIVVPEIGIPFSVEGVALINGANNPEGAQRFMDWFGSAEVINAFGQAFDYLPANPNALDGLSAETIAISEIPAQEINWEVVADNMGAWIERIYLNYLQ
ncbi:MAG: extracellular solute-binding protein [Turicibacter sp.]|nr:extracellular solute-binding protein [Turicibacter sp.]